jgi:hypothetical protein
MRPIFSELQVPSAAGDPLTEPLARFRSMARGSRWPTGALTARVHRGSKTPTRPATARRFSRAFGRPRALLRFLQMSVSTSTTTDHSNIPNHRIRGWDDCRPRESCLFLGATGPGPGEGAASNRLITARRGHVNARRLASRSRYLPSYGTEPSTLAGARRGALHRLAGLSSFRAFSPVYEDTD